LRISEVTRRDIADALTVEGVQWNGRFEETQFLARLFDLNRLPSTDGRFRTAEGDIWQHRVNNDDWDYYWVFQDSRFNLIGCDDDLYLSFLCEMIHPVVRPDSSEAEKIRQLFNSFLATDGYEIIEKTKISGKPVFIGRKQIGSSHPIVSSLKIKFEKADTTYVVQQITRMETAVENDPGLAIGTAKELIETCCKTILDEHGVDVPKDADLSALVRLTCKSLSLTPDDIPEKAKAADVIRKILMNMATITVGVAELRNYYGTGHGKTAKAKGLQSRHARLAVGAASTLALFLLETHEFRRK
jgi:hypothetical protein